MPAGDYTLTETQAPDGFSAAAPTSLTVSVNEDTKLTVVDEPVPPATGSLHIAAQDENGAALGGACFTIAGTEYCDNAADDSDNAGGSLQIAGLTVGTYTVDVTTTPAGFDTPKSQSVQIVADKSQDLLFTFNKSAPQTGGLQFNLKDANGKVVEGACLA